jgi:hypothetical protein
MVGWRPGGPPGHLSLRGSHAVSDNDAVPDWSSPATRAWSERALQDSDPRWNARRRALADETDELYAIPETAGAQRLRWAELQTILLVCSEGRRRGLGQRNRPARRPWTFSRSATAGMQRYGHSGPATSIHLRRDGGTDPGHVVDWPRWLPVFNHDAGDSRRGDSPAMYRQWSPHSGRFRRSGARTARAIPAPRMTART